MNASSWLPAACSHSSSRPVHLSVPLRAEDSRDESLVQAFLERHPSLLPGSHSEDGDSGHGPFPVAVIAKPKLPGLSDREPDFMWLASDSSSLYPVLIEIKTPHKAWFYGDRAEIHSDLTHALGQLAEWRAWFSRGHNQTAFLDYYDIPPELARRKLEPRYLLVQAAGSTSSPSPADAKNVPSWADLTSG